VGATVLSAIGANCGKIFYPEEKFTAIKNTMTITPDTKLINPRFLFSILQANTFPKRGGGQPFIAKGDVVQYQISIPPIDEQERIVELINAEASQVDSAKKLISTYESRTQAVIAKLWNE
jgi:type I restriction enzyme S subunit